MAIDYSQGDYRVVAKRLLPASQALVEWVSPTAGDLVVDVAAGTGNLARLVRDRAARAVAVDNTHAQLLLGAHDGQGIDWVTGDAAALPLRDGVADAALSVFGLIYVEQPRTAVADRGSAAPAGRSA